MRQMIVSIEREYHRYKSMADKALAQVSDEEFAAGLGAGSNEIGTIVKHVGGNLKSRFTDFLDSDGEKPWRQRDGEFELGDAPRAEVLVVWEQGWRTLFDALAALRDCDLTRMVTIRSEEMPVYAALHRSLAHTAAHVGQIVYVAKVLRGTAWVTLSIPRGRSAEFNRSTQGNP